MPGSSKVVASMSDFVNIGEICFKPAEVRDVRNLRRYFGWSHERIARCFAGVKTWHVRRLLEVTR